MHFINRKSTDPYFNLAAEEYILKNLTEDIFMLWQNQPSVIVGKHQNTLAEINLDFVTQNNLPVIRRISGGGTVFHDLGNLNFTFIKNGEAGKLVNFRKYTEPIIKALKTFGIEAFFEGKNNLTIQGKKISGNAEHIYKNRVLHHGTLLFSSRLEKLRSALLIDPTKYHGKAVKSISNDVTNIREHLGESISMLDFRNKIRDIVLSESGIVQYYELTEIDIQNIQQLANKKYKTWKWNFGYSPKYSFKKIIFPDGQQTEISIQVKNGIISTFKMHNSLTSKDLLETFGKHLVGSRHDYSEIISTLKNINLNQYFKNTTPEEIASGMF